MPNARGAALVGRQEDLEFTPGARHAQKLKHGEMLVNLVGRAVARLLVCENEPASLARQAGPNGHGAHQRDERAAERIKNLTTAIVKERVATHCVFTPGEILAGWEALRDWIATGEQPTARDIQETCKAIPGFGEACRIDPNFELPNPDKRMRPR